MRVAYLINQYPKISHSFIRREIFALEQLGSEISRISLRGWDLELVDEDDQLERKRTRYVLRDHWITWIGAAASEFLRRPVRFLCALGAAWRMSRGSPRPFHVHLVYLAEACALSRG